ncbi:MAG: hypothetical protein D6722_06545 [Bacteroidetes bacterium]|nr:MAG: hypothetical protein D6722_06545 [Bacteroidota bacterium]
MNVIIRYTAAALIFLALQVYLLDHLILWQVARPAVFLLFLLTLPFSLPAAPRFLIAFGMGIMVDWLGATPILGLNAFAAVLMVAVRDRLVGLLTASNYRAVGDITLSKQNALWLVSYLLPLIVLFHLTYFWLEDFSFQRFLTTLLKTGASSLYTFLLCFGLVYLFYRS